MTLSGDLDDCKIRVFTVSLAGSDVGLCGNPEVAVTLALLDRKYPRYQQQIVGQRIMGVKAVVKVGLYAVNRANLMRSLPWTTGAGNQPLAPAVLGGDLYAYAVALALHPLDKATDLSEDITLAKAVCTGGLNLKGDGDAEALVNLEFSCFPDRAQLPNIVLGNLGAVVA
jgi:hypothetical protein